MGEHKVEQQTVQGSATGADERPDVPDTEAEVALDDEMIEPFNVADAGGPFDEDVDALTDDADDDDADDDDADDDDDEDDDEDDDLDEDDELDDSDDEDSDDEDSDEDDAEDDDLDDLPDATDDEIDLVVAMYREDGQPVAVSLRKQLANDLDELINQLRRLPGDAGALGAVSIAGEFFVLCRVRGRNVQVFLSDAVSGNDWPLASDVCDYLGIEVPDPDDDPEPVGDLGILADAGVSEFDLENFADDLDEESDELVAQIARKAKFGPQFDKALQTLPR